MRPPSTPRRSKARPPIPPPDKLTELEAVLCASCGGTRFTERFEIAFSPIGADRFQLIKRNFETVCANCSSALSSRRIARERFGTESHSRLSKRRPEPLNREEPEP